jgi:hypothetical protein
MKKLLKNVICTPPPGLAAGEIKDVEPVVSTSLWD